MKRLLRRKKRSRYKKDSGLKSNVRFSIQGLFILTLVSIFAITIGYASFSYQLVITGEAHFRAEYDIRVMNVEVSGNTNGGILLYRPEFSRDTMITAVSLPNLDSSVTFSVEVTNFSALLPMMIRQINEINMSNSYIEYSITWNLEDYISELSTIRFYVTKQYRDDLTELPSNTTLESRIQFQFGVFDITPPVITEIPGPRVYFISQIPGLNLRNKITSIDNIDGDITHLTEITTNMNQADPSPGVYWVTFSSIDEAGNEAIPVTIHIEIWNMQQIETGQNATLLRGSDGSVWTFGANDMGQRGQGTTGNSNNATLRQPTQIPQSFFGDLPVVDIAAGQNTFYALNSAGQIFGWGNNASNRIGDGTTTNRNRPVRVGASVNMTFTQIDSQWASAIALGTDGNLWTWGDQAGTGTLGQGNTTTNRSAPTQITTTGNFVHAAIGRFGGAAVTDEGRVFVWGSNLHGQLGTGLVNAETAANRFPPREVDNISNIARVDYGERHILALSHDGYVYGWGQGSGGRLGNNQAIANILIPRRIDGMVNASDINTGNAYSQVRIGNTLFSFGPNADGRLFDGTASTNRLTPFEAVMENIAGNVSDMAGNSENSFILSRNGGTVWGVGRSTLNNQSFGTFFPTSGAANTVVTRLTPALSWDFNPEPR